MLASREACVLALVLLLGIMRAGRPTTDTAYNLIRIVIELASCAHMTLTRLRAFAAAAPTLFNGHFYEVIYSQVPFSIAVAPYRAYFEISGAFYAPHLLTISTTQERNFVHQNLGVIETWIAASDYGNEGLWRWVDGPEAGYVISSRYWQSGEPNNANLAEHYAISTMNGWIDTHANSGRFFVIEYELQHSTGGKMLCAAHLSVQS
jgi:hypothetical protein